MSPSAKSAATSWSPGPSVRVPLGSSQPASQPASQSVRESVNRVRFDVVVLTEHQLERATRTLDSHC